jgi:hypothetical protein
MSVSDGQAGRLAAARFSESLASAVRLGWSRPAFGLYLLALAVMPLKWASPLSQLYERAGWTDVLLGAAVAAWLYEHVRQRRRPRLHRWQLALAAYLALGIVSAALAAPRGVTVLATVVLMVELAMLATLTADFAGDDGGRAAIVVVVLATALLTLVLALVGVILFYAGVPTSLMGPYGEQFIASSRYGRVEAGFQSPALLSSWCIFASAIAARPAAPLSRRARIAMQGALALLCASTLSRGLVGFGLALALRTLLPRRSVPARALALAVVVAALGLLAVLTVGRLHLDPTRPASVTYAIPDPGNRRQAFVTSARTFGQHPLFGLGPGTLVGQNRGVPFRAHMTPLNVAATLGAPALAMLVAMFVLLWRDRRRPTDLASWSGLAGLGVDGLVNDVDHYRHVWILIGLIGARARRSGLRSH